MLNCTFVTDCVVRKKCIRHRKTLPDQYKSIRTGAPTATESTSDETLGGGDGVPVSCTINSIWKHLPRAKFLPLPFNGPTVITVFDLSCFDHPEAHPAERVRIMERGLPKALQRADHVIVISNHLLKRYVTGSMLIQHVSQRLIWPPTIGSSHTVQNYFPCPEKIRLNTR